MLWYTAKCRFLSLHSGEEPPHEMLGEFRFFLLKAEDEEVAREKARLIAKQREHSYKNQYGATVTWVFDSLIDVKQILNSELGEGAEIYSEYFSAAQNSVIEF